MRRPFEHHDKAISRFHRRSFDRFASPQLVLRRPSEAESIRPSFPACRRAASGIWQGKGAARPATTTESPKSRNTQRVSDCSSGCPYSLAGIPKVGPEPNPRKIGISGQIFPWTDAAGDPGALPATFVASGTSGENAGFPEGVGQLGRKRGPATFRRLLSKMNPEPSARGLAVLQPQVEWLGVRTQRQSAGRGRSLNPESGSWPSS